MEDLLNIFIVFDLSNEALEPGSPGGPAAVAIDTEESVDVRLEESLNVE